MCHSLNRIHNIPRPMVSVSHPMASLIEDKTIAGGLDTVKNFFGGKLCINIVFLLRC